MFRSQKLIAIAKSGHLINASEYRTLSEEFVLKGAKQVLSHANTHAVIIELAGFNRYNSSNAIIHELMIKNHFFPVQYFPEIREIKKLESFRIDQFNTIYIRNEKFVENRLINSPKYKIGNQYI